ncbi:MAG: alpha/beta fold hydrolase [Deltaproteobacteria bacterium]|nr:alpha/beta fold hydrolase [Deltaproteobacteria bacterium]
MSNALPWPLRPPAICPAGAEPVAHTAGATGLLVLHGFTGSPWEVRPLCDAAMARGWSVACPVLPGHATTVQALDAVGWRDWLHAADLAHQWLADRCRVVHLVGFSMGGLIATLLAERDSDQTARRLVLLAPAFALGAPQTLALRILATTGLVRRIGKSDPRLPDGQRPPCYHAVPVAGAGQLLALIAAVRERPRQVPGAILHLHGARDRTIAARLAARAVDQSVLGRVRRHTVDGGHLLLRDGCATEVVATILAFLEGRD